jgi:hypothetical protein
MRQSSSVIMGGRLKRRKMVAEAREGAQGVDNPPKTGGGQPSEVERIRRSRKWRWPTALALMALGVLASGAGLYSGAGVCRDATAGVRTVRLCAPPSTAELVLLFVPALAFLFPDLSEINVFGFGIKREIDKVEEDIDKVSKEQVDELAKATGELGTELASRMQDVERVSADGPKVLRRTLKKLADLERRIASLEGG